MAKELKKEIVFSSVFQDKTGGMARLKSSINSLNEPLNQINRKIKKTASGFTKIQAALNKGVQGLRNSIGIASVFSGIGSIISLKEAADFEEELNKIKAVVTSTSDEIDKITGKPRQITLTTKGFEEIKQMARDVGKSTQFSSVDALLSAKIQGSGGRNDQEILKATAPLMYLTGAAQIKSDVSLADVTAGSVNAMSAFGIKTDKTAKFADQLAYTMLKSAQVFEELIEATTKFAPTFKSFGIDHAIGLGMEMVLADKGIKGSEAGTAMSSFAARMANPPAEAGRVINKYLSYTDKTKVMDIQTGKFRDPIALFKKLVEKKALPGEIMALLGQEAGKHLTSLFNPESIDRLVETVRQLKDPRTVSGTAKRLNDSSMAGLNGEIRLLQSAASDLAIEMGEQGLLAVFTKLTRALTGLVDTLNNLPKPVLKAGTYTITALGTIFASMFSLAIIKKAVSFSGLGSLGLKAISSILIGTKVAITRIFSGTPGLFGTIIRFFGSMMGFVLSLKGLLIASVIAVSGALVFIGWFILKNKDRLLKTFPKLKNFLDFTEEYWDRFKDLMNSINEKIKIFTADKYTKIVTKAKATWEVLTKGLDDIFSNITGKLKNFLENQWKNLKRGVFNLLDDPDNKQDWDFNPFDGTGPAKPSVHERFKGEATKTKVADGKEKTLAKIRIELQNAPPGTKTTAKTNDRTPIDVFTGYRMEAIG